MHDILGWAMRSPRRLVGVVLGACVLVLVVGSLMRSAGDRGVQESRTPSPTASVTAEVPSVQPPVAAAVRFAGAWAQVPAGQTGEQWLAQVKPMVTPELAAGLQLTDPGSLPGGSPVEPAKVRFLAPASALVSVPLSGGESVLVTVVKDGSIWLVSDVQPDVGDVGAP